MVEARPEEGRGELGRLAKEEERERWKEALRSWNERGSAAALLAATAQMGPPEAGKGINDPLDRARAEVFKALASLGRSEELERLMKLGHSLRCPPDADSLLICAIRAKQGACVKWLLSQDESLANAPSAKGASPLEEAAALKATEAVMALIPVIDPLKAAPNGAGALKALAACESPTAIKALFARLTRDQTRLALTQKDHQGASGLMALAEALDAETLKAVLIRAKKCEGLIDQRKHSGESALHVICHRAGLSALSMPRPEALKTEAAAELVGILLDAGFEPNVIAKEGSLPLLEIAIPFFSDSSRPVPPGALEIVKSLLEAGADPRLEGRRAMTLKALASAPRANAELRALVEASDLRSSLQSLADLPFADDPAASKELLSHPAPRL